MNQRQLTPAEVREKLAFGVPKFMSSWAGKARDALGRAGTAAPSAVANPAVQAEQAALKAKFYEGRGQGTAASPIKFKHMQADNPVEYNARKQWEATTPAFAPTRDAIGNRYINKQRRPQVNPDAGRMGAFANGRETAGRMWTAAKDLGTAGLDRLGPDRGRLLAGGMVGTGAGMVAGSAIFPAATPENVARRQSNKHLGTNYGTQSVLSHGLGMKAGSVQSSYAFLEGVDLVIKAAGLRPEYTAHYMAYGSQKLASNYIRRAVDTVLDEGKTLRDITGDMADMGGTARSYGHRTFGSSGRFGTSSLDAMPLEDTRLHARNSAAEDAYVPVVELAPSPQEPQYRPAERSQPSALDELRRLPSLFKDPQTALNTLHGVASEVGSLLPNVPHTMALRKAKGLREGIAASTDAAANQYRTYELTPEQIAKARLAIDSASREDYDVDAIRQLLDGEVSDARFQATMGAGLSSFRPFESADRLTEIAENIDIDKLRMPLHKALYDTDPAFADLATERLRRHLLDRARSFEVDGAVEDAYFRGKSLNTALAVPIMGGAVAAPFAATLGVDHMLSDADTPQNRVKNLSNKHLGTDFDTQSRLSRLIGG